MLPVQRFIVIGNGLYYDKWRYLTAKSLHDLTSHSYPSWMEEIIDIVNEFDEVIAQAPRKEVHLRQQMHRSTHIILRNSDQQVFLQLRAKTKETNPGVWDSSAAGHVDAGETYVDCAARELEEELSVRVPAQALVEIGRLAPTMVNGFEFVRIYAAQSDDPIKLEFGEIDGGKWVSDGELNQWITENPEDFAPSFLVIWEAIRYWRESGVSHT